MDEGVLLDAKNEECQEGSLSEANKASLDSCKNFDKAIW